MGKTIKKTTTSIPIRPNNMIGTTEYDKISCNPIARNRLERENLDKLNI
jgi:hypothetical protein